MGRILRLCLRIPALILVTTLIYTILVAGKAITRPWPATYQRWRGFFVRHWARGIARIIGMRITVHGSPPTRPFLLVSNHVSYIDIILFFTQVNSIFVAKGDLRYWPIFNYIIKAGDTIFIDRASKRDIVRVNGLIAQAIQRGEGVIVFPEGTSSRGDDLLPFKPSLFDYAARQRFPVSFAALHYRTPAGSPPADLAVCWWGDMAFLPHFINLLQLPRFDATLTFGHRTFESPDRKHLADTVREMIKQIFRPIVIPAQTAPSTEKRLDPRAASGVMNE